MNEIVPHQERVAIARPNTLLDKETFQQIAEIASMMASASLIPDSLAFEGTGDRKKPLPYETVRANCFLVANQAIKWGMDPFAVAQCCSVVHGRLMFEGKLVSAVIENSLGIKLVHAYGKWDAAKEACIIGEDGTGDNLAIRIGEGRYDDAGKAIFTGRFVDGHVGGWKTTGNNSPWRPGRSRVMLIYRGTREFARIYEPGVMLGVITDDEYDPAFNARDITPPASAGGSVIERLKQSQSNNGAGGFDPDRVKNDLDTAAPPRGGDDEKPRSSSQTVDEPNPNSSTVDNSPADPAIGSREAEGAGSESGNDPAPSNSDHDRQWLFNVGVMLWSATNFNGDVEVLKNQRAAANEAYPAKGVSQPFLDKARSVFNNCMAVTQGTLEPDDGLKMVAGIIGCEDKELQAKAKGGKA